jgi:ribosomal 30S subunit maturation factor RimM
MERRRIVLGRVSGLFGVQGWVKVFSDTRPREQIIGYDPVQLGRGISGGRPGSRPAGPTPRVWS